MHIIAGQFKGRKLEMPVDKDIRPTPGKVKEAIFSIVVHDLDEAVVIDLFAGTGSLGLEALSRGAKKVYFGEKTKTGFDLINRNIAATGAENQCRLIRGDWEAVLTQIHEPADIIFLDPPYEAGLMESCLNAIRQKNLLATGGIIVSEHDARQILPEVIGGFSIWKTRKYGNTSITLYIHSLEETS
ncbi:16S rRNA (guanine(966)-N(2))-methyltransferase RsmD [Bacillota bacterium]